MRITYEASHHPCHPSLPAYDAYDGGDGIFYDGPRCFLVPERERLRRPCVLDDLRHKQRINYKTQKASMASRVICTTAPG